MPKKRPHRVKLAKLPPQPTVKVDPKLEAEWNRLHAIIEDATERGAEAFDELREAVGRVIHHNPPLYAFGGYSGAKDFCARGLKTKYRTAMRNVEIAEHATPKEEETYGTSNVYAALEYIRAKFGKLGATLPVAFDRLKIPVHDGAHTKMVKFADATFVQIQAAKRSLLNKGRATMTDHAEAAIGKVLAKHAAFKSVHFTVQSGLVHVHGIPLASLGLFARVLSTVKLPNG